MKDWFFGKKEQKVIDSKENDEMYQLYDKCRTLCLSTQYRFRDTGTEHGDVIFRTAENIEKLLCLEVEKSLHKIGVDYDFTKHYNWRNTKDRLRKAYDILSSYR